MAGVHSSTFHRPPPPKLTNRMPHSTSQSTSSIQELASPTHLEHRFSFKRLLGESGHFEVKCANAELTLDDEDRLFEHQMWSRNPKHISSNSLYVIDVTPSERLAEEAYHKLVKEGYIIEPPNPDIDTSKISNKMKSHLAFLPEYGQNRVACVLHAWKREIERMKALEDEERRIQEKIEGMESGVEVPVGLQTRLREVQRLLKLKPSLRDPNEGRLDQPK
ncbi:uncharacterized protein PV09_03174 [Verruconis gallopava]|uniref:Uncharacterized protein n=1 Tax=Verruconis gallopava TaxID=253628 RepID=A0A0D2AHH4_9PEZI|nr:uncharacterized protein PV09_03174 [Verruconis gallopava]KIW05990.1 hypothetical protein PV09_03174 [Verruconis gallopava]